MTLQDDMAELERRWRELARLFWRMIREAWRA